MKKRAYRYRNPLTIDNKDCLTLKANQPKANLLQPAGVPDT
ncbi:hypothetical protein V22_37390 [Calycomorphotria hydatis]|uniref:Uncharacterized protein n=1 Tax=Calycomorphotria hydatis TaxID=2528027 RepID=A0A517TDM2_9PLAN|nr:hypothetical protein V22_37390 [Calycomorphotria hydatis]